MATSIAGCYFSTTINSNDCYTHFSTWSPLVALAVYRCNINLLWALRVHAASFCNCMFVPEKG